VRVGGLEPALRRRSAGGPSRGQRIHRIEKECKRIAASSGEDPRLNEEIDAPQVRLIAADGSQVGIVPIAKALGMARDLDLDLVEVASQASPPVCRLMDFGKFKFDEAQKAKESRRKSTHATVKEMKYRPKIGEGDFETKTRQVAKFLEEGHKVKVTIMFRGREVNHPELGMKILERIAEQVDGTARTEAAPKLDGRNMTMLLAPTRKKDAGSEARTAAEQAEQQAPA
jgi:translation initiation factor IF-3